MSWENIADSYDKLVGKKGHYFHQKVILPNLQKQFFFHNYKNPSLLDLGCGQGFLQNYLPTSLPYLGIDVSPSLIQRAKKNHKGPFKVEDLGAPLFLENGLFTHVTYILSLQNIPFAEMALQNGIRHLRKNGKLFIVLNHPCFRIPRQTSWGIDKEKNLQYRKIETYLSPLSIPIETHPSKKKSPQTLSYHRPISFYINLLGSLGFGISHMEEWVSDKQSKGRMAKRENRARKEIPLFLFILAQPVTSSL